jgi:DNA-directed RNA polymerase subunit M/transcription elongation factor TFIIS
MAYETVEYEFPCPCGKGKMTAMWKEHDTYPSSTHHVEWQFECPDCAENYVFYQQHTVRKGDAEKHRAMSANRNAADALWKGTDKKPLPRL